MSLETEIRKKLTDRGVAFVHFVDVSHLPEQQTKGMSSAILFGMPLSPEFIQEVVNKDDYVHELVQNNRQDEDEFSLKEIAADRIADDLANYLQTEGYPAYSQSEKNLTANGCYDACTHSTLLPHKTIAVLAGLGWIGKNNLLITPEYGSAISMCTLLTTAPLPAVSYPAGNPKCGACTICKDICPVGAIKGKDWNKNSPRDERIDVYSCTTCLKCLVHCPRTLAYAKNSSNA